MRKSHCRTWYMCELQWKTWKMKNTQCRTWYMSEFHWKSGKSEMYSVETCIWVSYKERHGKWKNTIE